MARVFLKGLPSLKRKLKKLQEDTAPAFEIALASAAEQVTEKMKSAAPKKSGALRDSIGWTFGDAPKYSQRLAFFKKRLAEKTIQVTIYAGNSSVRYSHIVEFGSAPHKAGGQFAGADHPGTRAKPFFYSTYRSEKRRIKRMLRKAIDGAITKAIR